MKELLTSVTIKGQITIPAEIRPSLGIKEGDKVAVLLLEAADGKEAQAVLTPIHPVAEMTFGAVPPLKEELTWEQIREIAREKHAQHIARK